MLWKRSERPGRECGGIGEWYSKRVMGRFWWLWRKLLRRSRRRKKNIIAEWWTYILGFWSVGVFFCFNTFWWLFCRRRNANHRANSRVYRLAVLKLKSTRAKRLLDPIRTHTPVTPKTETWPEKRGRLWRARGRAVKVGSGCFTPRVKVDYIMLNYKMSWKNTETYNSGNYLRLPMCTGRRTRPLRLRQRTATDRTTGPRRRPLRRRRSGTRRTATWPRPWLRRAWEPAASRRRRPSTLR